MNEDTKIDGTCMPLPQASGRLSDNAQESAGSASRLSDALVKTLLNEVSPERRDGLFLVDMPTGYGKSYAAQSLLGVFVADERNRDRRIFYITPQKKNLPSDEDIERAFKSAGLESPEPGLVLRVQPLHEMIAENATVERLGYVPPNISSSREFKELMSAAECYRQATKLEDEERGLPGYVDATRKRLGDAERQFRNMASRLLALDEDVKGDEGRSAKKLSRKKRIARLRNDADWQWLGRLYPTVFTRDARILLMSVDKFIYNHVTLVDPPYRFVDSDLVKGSVVIVDEFDASKAALLDSIIKDSIEAKADLPGLVRTMNASLSSKAKPADLTRASGKRKKSERAAELSKILEDAEKVVKGAFEEANLRCEFKSEGKETVGDFIFYDFRHNAVIDGDYVVRNDLAAQVNWITRAKEEGEGGTRLTKSLGSMRGAVHYVQGAVGSLARNYMERRNEIPGSDGGYTIDSAQKSVLDWLGFREGAQSRFMLSGVQSSFRKPRKARGRRSPLMAGDLSVYECGFHCINLVDGDEHDMRTDVQICAMQVTPESVMLRLMDKARVIGLSATATLDSALCNYDLEYLQAQSGKVERVSGGVLEEMRRAYDAQNSGYDDVTVDVRLINAKGDSPEGWMAVLGNAEAARAAHDVVRGEQGYVCDRYARLAAAFVAFLRDESIGSMLALTMAAPKPGRDNALDSDKLSAVLGIAAQCLGMHGGADRHVRYIGGSSNFENEFEGVKEELASGQRVFLVAAYSTMGTGVNIQYPIPEGVETVEIYPLVGSAEKDFDAIYLDRPTNLAPYSQPLDEKGLMKALFEICELRERGEVSRKNYTKAFKTLARCYSSKKPKKGMPKLMDTKSARGKATWFVNQAVGRICRTNVKSPVVRIFADAGLGGRINLFAMDGCMVNREYQALVDELKRTAEGARAPSADPESRAALISERLNVEIQKLVRRKTWSADQMRFWEQLRRAVLEKPTCMAEDAAATGGLVYNTYVHPPEPMSSYTYAQEGDFGKVKVSFDPADTLGSRVRQDEARLELLAKIPEIAERFEGEGWPLSWEPGDYLMSPVLFRNIYLGALGEQAGKAVLEKRIEGLRLESIEDGGSFEKFDFVVAGTRAYVDFKYWSGPSGEGEDEAVERIGRKLDAVGGDLAVVCNVLGRASDGYECRQLLGRRVLTVPMIVDVDSAEVWQSNVDQIRTFLGSR